MLKNENIIILSPIDWDFHWQAPQQLATDLAAKGNNVLFVENTGVRAPTLKDAPRVKERLANWCQSTKGFQEKGDNLYIFSPVIAPFTCSGFFRPINRTLLLKAINRWCKITGFHNPIILTFLPTYISLDLAEGLDYKLLVYYCADNYASTAQNPKKLKAIEKTLIEKADLVFTTIKGLVDNCKQYREDVHLFPYGVDLSKFKGDLFKVPDDLSAIPKPTVGFIGTIKRHMDFDLLKHIVLNNPSISFVFVGAAEINIEKMKYAKNMYFLGKKDHQELPQYAYNFDINIIPYKINEYTKYVSPGKIYEYIYTGRPIITTAMPSLLALKDQCPQALNIANNKEEFNALIKQLINPPSVDSEKLKKQRAFAENFSYANMIPRMIELIKKTVDKKPNVITPDWKQRIVTFYAEARARIKRLVLTTAVLLALLFYTPVIWLSCSWLKINQAPKKADAIVVFAGGVGESGKAGQGYEERVQHAVNLYKQNYAKNLVFSSGYMYALKEPSVMKALAVSLGVPENSIFIETKARNSYENVVFTNEIIKNKQWNKILLVSSPYHMKRAQLIFNKNAKDLEVIYTPIENSRFYQRGTSLKAISLKQIKALAHEIIGIIYYKIKGYI